MTGSLHLVVRRTIRASPERLFSAWTQPEQLMQWWGPRGVRCTHAEMDLRVGGLYRLANQLPDDGGIIWIVGEFIEVTAPRRLIYSWRREDAEVNTPMERVTVDFVAVAEGTEVRVLHERLLNDTVRAGHAHGWAGCLDGLEEFVQQRREATEHSGPNRQT